MSANPKSETPRLEAVARPDLLSMMSIEERRAVEHALIAGYNHGFGNVIAWLATAWAVKLRDDGGLLEEFAVEHVRNRNPYPLPPPPPLNTPERPTRADHFP